MSHFFSACRESFASALEERVGYVVCLVGSVAPILWWGLPAGYNAALLGKSGTWLIKGTAGGWPSREGIPTYLIYRLGRCSLCCPKDGYMSADIEWKDISLVSQPQRQVGAKLVSDSCDPESSDFSQPCRRTVAGSKGERLYLTSLAAKRLVMAEVSPQALHSEEATLPSTVLFLHWDQEKQEAVTLGQGEVKLHKNFAKTRPELLKTLPSAVLH